MAAWRTVERQNLLFRPIRVKRTSLVKEVLFAWDGEHGKTWKTMKDHTTAALRVEPFHILKTNEYCTPILEIAPLKTIQPDSVRGNATHPPDIRIWGRAPSLPGQGQMQNHTTSLSLKNCTPFTSVSIRIGWIHPDGQFFRFWWISSNEHFIVYIIVNSFKSPLIVAALAGTEGFDLPQRGRRLAYLLTVARERGAVFIGF